MKPDILPGDMVETEPLQAGVFQPGIVISVRQANEIPDAKVRGLQDTQPWSYWIFFPEGYPNSNRRGIRGPFMRTQIHHART